MSRGVLPSSLAAGEEVELTTLNVLAAEEAVRGFRHKHASNSHDRTTSKGVDLRGKQSVDVLCLRQCFKVNLYNRWSKEFLEMSKHRLWKWVYVETPGSTG